MVIEDPADARVIPNVTVRALGIEYKEAKMREWEAAERLWMERNGGKGKGEGQGNEGGEM